MEFSDDYSSFQMKPLRHSISSDFSTEFASCIKRTRNRSRSSMSLSSTKKESQTNLHKSDKVKIDRRIFLSSSFLVIILIAIVLPLFQPSSSSDDLFDMKYITVTDRPKIIKKEIDSANNAEALKSVQLALDMKHSNKIDNKRTKVKSSN